MLNELNKLNLNQWQNDPNISVSIGKIIENATWKTSPFEPLTGSGQDRGIRTYKVNDTQPYRPRLKAQLTGSGVRGNADFNTNFDNLEILSQTIYPDVVGNSIKSPIKQYSKMQHIDFIKESTESLTEWLRKKRDRYFTTALSNEITNCVVCDSANGYKDTSTDKSVQSASRKIVAGDVLNLKALRRAIFMARAGKKYNGKEAFPIKPIRATSHTINGLSIQNYSYVILLDTYQINQLRNDPEWVAMQRVGVRGDKNNLFTGLVGMVDECPVLDMGVWTALEPGLLNSDISDEDFKDNIYAPNFDKITPPSYYTDSQALSIGFLIGASAVVMAGSEQVSFYISEVEDAGRKIVCGADRLMAISKGKFHSSNANINVYDGQDFAVIGIFSSKE